MPSPLCHTTRLTPTCCGHAPVLAEREEDDGPDTARGFSLPFAVRAADDRSIISCGYVESSTCRDCRAYSR